MSIKSKRFGTNLELVHEGAVIIDHDLEAGEYGHELTAAFLLEELDEAEGNFDCEFASRVELLQHVEALNKAINKVAITKGKKQLKAWRKLNALRWGIDS